MRVSREINTNQQYSSFGEIATKLKLLAQKTLLLLTMFFATACFLVSSQVSADGLFNFQMKLAVRGNPEAQFKVGEMYETGFGVEQNTKEAVKWITKAASKGHETANFKLLYWDMEKNDLNNKNRNQFEGLKVKAEAGNPQAEYYLGKMYAHGVGVKKDSDKAIDWLNKAVFVGVFAAENELVLTRENKQREVLDKRRREEKKRAQREAKKEAEKQQKLKQQAEQKRQLELKQKEDAQALIKQQEAAESAAKEKQLEEQLERQRTADKAAKEQAERRRAERQREEAKKAALLKKLEENKKVRKSQFESDPCSGKSARFLSTCR